MLIPKIIATLGAVALEGLRAIDYHNFTLKEEVASVLERNTRLLILLYQLRPQVVASHRLCPGSLPIFQF